LASRVGRIRAQFTSLGDVGLALRVFGWALVLPVLKHLVPIRSLARVMHVAPSPSFNRHLLNRSNPRDGVLEGRIVTFARWGARLIRWRSGGNCLERGLIAFRYLGAAGANPTLVVGLGPDDRGGMIGHAWVLLDGRPAGESEASVGIYTPVFAFASDGTLLDPPDGARRAAAADPHQTVQGRVT
jgi:hypothetical protein